MRPQKKSFKEISDKDFDILLKEKERERQLLESTGIKKLYTCEEVALYLGIHVESLYERLKIDRFPHIKFGNSIRFSEENIKDFIKYHQEYSQLTQMEINQSEGLENE